MSRLVQIAQRSNKAPVGFKVQLVVHRLNANLALKHNTELVAIVMGRKKKIPTKSAPYQPAAVSDDGSLRRLNGTRSIQASQSKGQDIGEVVWGDMVAFSSTLYRAKTGLFQAKRFQIHVNTTGEFGKTVAVFEFNLAELVPLSNDSGKESVRLNVTKCPDDPRASISLTVVSSRVYHDGVLRDKERSCAEDSASELGSEMSAFTNHSRASSLASTCRRNIDSPILSQVGGFGDGKADAIRIAGHATTSDDAVGAADNVRDEFVKKVQSLEVQLRDSESANVTLVATIKQKDREIERLTRIAAGLGGSSTKADDNVLQVDFLVYMELKEEYDALKLEHEACQTTAMPVAHSATGMFTINDVESEEELTKDESRTGEENAKNDAFETLANEYEDVEEAHPVFETNTLKRMLATQRSEAQQLTNTVNVLTLSNNELEDQLRTLQTQMRQKDEEIQHFSAALQRAKSVRNDVDEADIEAEVQADCALETASSDNRRLKMQLLKFDGVMTAMEEEKAHLSIQLREAESTSAAAQNEIIRVRNALEQFESIGASMSEKLHEADQAREVAEKNVVVAESTIDTLQQQVRDVSSQLLETQYELETLREGQLLASSEALDKATAKHQKLERLWEDAKNENERLKARVEELEAWLARSEVDGDEKAAELQAQVHEVKREADALREELDSLRASSTQIEIESYARELNHQEAIESHHRIALDQNQRLGAASMAREELFMRLQEQIEQTERMSEELSAKVVTLQEELDYFQGELIESKMKVAQLTQDNDELAIRNRHLEKERAFTTKTK